ncbi:protein serine/threonine phosphatase 2C [Trametes polyzona]|nr:protein serine/threonine phosphatase 2C [Trametes polyzona]
MNVWDIQGDKWLYLAVFDGHGGTTNVAHRAPALSMALERTLRYILQRNVPEGLDQKFDQSIGDALRNIFPNPADLDEEQARKLIDEHYGIVCRAFEGSIVALVIINVDKRFMWVVSVGDFTVALFTVGEDGKRRAQRLCEIHMLRNPREFFRATMAHKSKDGPVVSPDDRTLGWTAVPRSIGDFSLKLDASYLTHLFRYTPYGDSHPTIVQFAPKIVTPPYVIAEPSVQFTDLDAVWGAQSQIVLFTDGVDTLVDGFVTFTPQKRSGADPLDVVSALLADEADPRIEEILGHKIEPRWSRDEQNRAVDILGNLPGGTNVERLEKVTDQDALAGTVEGPPFYIDDVSIIVCGLGDD